MLETLVRLDIQYHVAIQWRPVKIVKIEKISRWVSKLESSLNDHRNHTEKWKGVEYSRVVEVSGNH